MGAAVIVPAGIMPWNWGLSGDEAHAADECGHGSLLCYSVIYFRGTHILGVVIRAHTPNNKDQSWRFFGLFTLYVCQNALFLLYFL